MSYEDYIRSSSASEEEKLAYEVKQLEKELASAQDVCKRALGFLRIEQQAGTFDNRMLEFWEEFDILVWDLEEVTRG